MFIDRLKSIPEEIKLVLVLFFATRVPLAVIGVCSRLVGDNYQSPQDGRAYSAHSWLNIWGQWDSRWYRRIAEGWYPPHISLNGQSEYAFMPFYPLLMKIAGFWGHHYFLAGVIISNAALLVSSIVLYKLVKLEYPHKIAMDSVLFLYLFPSAFILSGALSESLFLMLVLMCFYFAKKENWFLSGLCGLFLSLTRSQGAVLIVSLLYIYFKQRAFSFKRIGPDILFLLLVPLGIFVFCAYTYFLTGDGLAYVHLQEKFWHNGAGFGHPLMKISSELFGGDITFVMGIWFTAIVLLLLFSFIRTIGFEYWIYSLATIFLPLFMFHFDWCFVSIPRYCLTIFPLFIILALLSRNEHLRTALIIFSTLLQGFYMVFWAKSFPLVV